MLPTMSAHRRHRVRQRLIQSVSRNSSRRRSSPAASSSPIPFRRRALKSVGSNGETILGLKGERAFEVDVWTFNRRCRLLRPHGFLVLPRLSPRRRWRQDIGADFTVPRSWQSRITRRGPGSRSVRQSPFFETAGSSDERALYTPAPMIAPVMGARM